MSRASRRADPSASNADTGLGNTARASRVAVDLLIARAACPCLANGPSNCRPRDRSDFRCNPCHRIARFRCAWLQRPILPRVAFTARSSAHVERLQPANLQKQSDLGCFRPSTEALARRTARSVALGADRGTSATGCSDFNAGCSSIAASFRATIAGRATAGGDRAASDRGGWAASTDRTAIGADR